MFFVLILLPSSAEGGVAELSFEENEVNVGVHFLMHSTSFLPPGKGCAMFTKAENVEVKCRTNSSFGS